MTLTETQRRMIQDLHARYIRLIDDDRIEEWPELFTDYCLYRITTRENFDKGQALALMDCQGQGMLADRVTGLRKIESYDSHYYSHQISGLWVESFDGETAVCRSNYLVIQTMADGEMSVFSAGVYLDKIALDREEAKFEERIVVADSRHLDTLLLIPL
jgi:anthranilate 1,2-dioxygenase small subunit